MELLDFLYKPMFFLSLLRLPSMYRTKTYDTRPILCIHSMHATTSHVYTKDGKSCSG